jgi:uncharacterized Zn finger protein
MYYDFDDPSSHSRRPREAEAQKTALIEDGFKFDPIVISKRAIAETFWGKTWCQHLEAYHNYENRLPRGKSYARQGRVAHLGITAGLIHAHVEGSQLYEVHIRIAPMESELWQSLVSQCSGSIESIASLLDGSLSESIISLLIAKDAGILPMPGDVRMGCTCPDDATVCKHVAAALYGVGHRLDRQPDLLFILRSLDPAALLSATKNEIVRGIDEAVKDLDSDELSRLFGVDIEV